MASIFARSCILLGDLDSFCVGCSKYIPGDESIIEHIQKSKHTVKIPMIHYVEKYRDDFIKKISGVYFCELCNTVINTGARVSMHITTEEHMTHKRRQLKRVGSSIVFQNKYLISDDAWNSFVEDTCLICDIEYDDPLVHKYDTNHHMKVVKTKVIFDEKDNIYRQIGGGYQCLTCNDVLSDNRIREHLESASHREAYVLYDPNRNLNFDLGLTTTDEETPIESEENTRKDEEYEGEDEQSTEKDDDDENLEEDGDNNEGNTERDEGENQEGSTERNEDRNKEGNEEGNEEREDDKDKNEANRDRDDENKDNDEDDKKEDDENKEDEEMKEVEEIEEEEAGGGIIEEVGIEDIEMAMSNEPVASCSNAVDTILYTRLTQVDEPIKPIPKEVEEYAKKNNLYLNRKNSSVYCNPCSCLLKPEIVILKEHISGRRHRDLVRQRSLQEGDVGPPKVKHRKRIEKVKMQGFVKSLHEFKTGNGDYVVVNEQFCLASEDYMGYAAQGTGTMCMFCNLELTSENVETHKESHMKVMKSLFLITSLESEFVRQVNTELYHCGFCGKVKTKFDDMLEHLFAKNHMKQKIIYLKLLKRFMTSNPLERVPVEDIMQLANIFQ